MIYTALRIKYSNVLGKEKKLNNYEKTHNVLMKKLLNVDSKFNIKNIYILEFLIKLTNNVISIFIYNIEN